jgi:hypothetical protein
MEGLGIHLPERIPKDNPRKSWRLFAFSWLTVPVQREMERGALSVSEIPPFGRGFSRHEDLSVRCGFFFVFLGGADLAPPLIDHRPR